MQPLDCWLTDLRGLHTAVVLCAALSAILCAADFLGSDLGWLPWSEDSGLGIAAGVVNLYLLVIVGRHRDCLDDMGSVYSLLGLQFAAVVVASLCDALAANLAGLHRLAGVFHAIDFLYPVLNLVIAVAVCRLRGRLGERGRDGVYSLNPLAPRPEQGAASTDRLLGRV